MPPRAVLMIETDSFKSLSSFELIIFSVEAKSGR